MGHSWYALAWLYHVHMQDYDRAETFYDRAAENYNVSLLPGTPFAAYPSIGKGVMFLQRGDTALAEAPLRAGLRVYERGDLQETDIRMVGVKSHLATCLRGLGRYDEAEDYLLPMYKALKDKAGMEEGTPKILERLVELYEAWDKSDEAMEYQARLDSLQSAMDVQEK